MLFSIKRTGFRMSIPLSDAEIWCVGMVAYQWAMAEGFFEMLISIANGKPLEREDGKRISFKARARVLKSLINTKAIEPARTELNEIVDHLLGVQLERDRMMHHLWSYSQDGKWQLGVSD